MILNLVFFLTVLRQIADCFTRGAQPSNGRTSWSANPEVDDFSTVIGFAYHYSRYFGAVNHASCPSPMTRRSRPISNSVLLMAGYSYGAMVTTMLSPLQVILERFHNASAGSSAAEVLLRAQSLTGGLDNNIFMNTIIPDPTQRQHRPVQDSSTSDAIIRVGGDEVTGQIRINDYSHRRSRSISADWIKSRHNFESWMRADSGSCQIFNQSEDLSTPKHAPNSASPSLRDFVSANGAVTAATPAYILISPLQGIVRHLASISLASMFSRPDRGRHELPLNGSDTLFTQYPTLVIYGTQDSFVSIQKLRQWSLNLSRIAGQEDGHSGPIFVPVEIEGAGHVWSNSEYLSKLTGAIKHFATDLTHTASSLDF